MTTCKDHRIRNTDYTLDTPYNDKAVLETVSIKVCINCGMLFVHPTDAKYMATVHKAD